MGRNRGGKEGDPAGEERYLGGEVLEDGGEVDGRAPADALGVLARLEVARDAADGELQPGLGRPRHRLGALGLAPAAAGTHLPLVPSFLPSFRGACRIAGAGAVAALVAAGTGDWGKWKRAEGAAAGYVEAAAARDWRPGGADR